MRQSGTTSRRRFPRRRFTVVESAPSRGKPWVMVELWKLALDGSGAKKRLTHFTEYKGTAADNAVVSDDGRYVAFQMGRRGAESGEGFGLFLLDLQRRARCYAQAQMSLSQHPAGYRQITFLWFDQRILVLPYPPCAELFGRLAFAPDPELAPATTEENYYQVYSAVAAARRPRTYLEIGTRFGYSTVAVAAGAPELRRVVSCDLQAYDNPYALPSQEIAERNLRAAGFQGETRFLVEDSRRLPGLLAGERFDLILVDGDHSYEGCLTDMENCYELLSPGGILMVDDLDMPPVFSAVQDAVERLAISPDQRCFLPTKHGLYLIRRA